MKDNHIPPKLAQRILQGFLRHDLAEEVKGDLEENFYHLLEHKSLLKAQLNYWYQVLHYLRPFAFRKSISSSLNYSIMVRHTVLLSFRNFKRYKSSFFINLTGLSAGLAATLLIYLWVNDELKVDMFNEKDSRLYQMMENRVKADGIWTSPTSPGLMAETLAADMPEIDYAASATRPQPATLSIGENNIKATGRYAGKEYFNIFSYSILSGDKNKILADKNTIAISDALAKKLFNTDETVLGKTIEFQHEQQFTVSAVFRKMPSNASEQFDFVIPYEKFKDGRDWLLNWGNTGVMTYVLLKQGSDVTAFNAKIKDYIKTKTNNEITHRTPFLKAYSETYLYGKYENGVLVGGRITYVKLFSIIACFIMIIACINFMNLSTAKASRRIKEVGIKKAVGAARGELIIQYLGESMVMTFLSLLIAIGLVILFLPQFNIITGKHLALTPDPHLILSVLGITLFTGFISGSYPALYLSGFNAATILKGKLNTSLGELIARKGLVIIQFALSVIFIVSVIVVYKQIQFVQSANLGYQKENIIRFEREGKIWENKNLETLLTEIKNTPGVAGVSSITHDMTGHNSGTSGVEWPGKNLDDKTEFEKIAVNYGMMETLEISMLSGRTFSPAYSSDTTKIIFNEAGIKFMGMTDPVGKMIKLWGKDMQIIGIAKDFHFESLHENVKPLFFRLAPEDTHLIMAKLSGKNQPETIEKLQTLYAKINPGFSLDYEYLDTDYQAQYVAEQRVATLSKYFVGLAILISCLGLFGLASFTAERRNKEIGIRKVLGASELGIVYLLSSDFTKIIIISIVIALPASFMLTKSWLSDFAFKIQLEWWYFIGSGLLVLAIAWLTVGAQAFKAARINPAKSLKEQ